MVLTTLATPGFHDAHRSRSGSRRVEIVSDLGNGANDPLSSNRKLPLTKRGKAASRMQTTATSHELGDRGVNKEEREGSHTAKSYQLVTRSEGRGETGSILSKVQDLDLDNLGCGVPKTKVGELEEPLVWDSLLWCPVE